MVRKPTIGKNSPTGGVRADISFEKELWDAAVPNGGGQPLTEDRHLDRMMGNILRWSHPWHDRFGLAMKVPSTMLLQEEMSGKRSFYPGQIMRSSFPTLQMPFTSMALSFIATFSWQTTIT